jgi:hypothetical protein
MWETRIHTHKKQQEKLVSYFNPYIFGRNDGIENIYIS